jgi:AcrR family transcriptional regulator
MPFERYYRLPPQRRSMLLEAAADEFAREGYDGASLNRILAKGGLSKGSYYFYFVDKIDLFATVLEQVITDLSKKLPPVDPKKLTPETFWPTMETIADTWTDLAVTTPHVMKLTRAMRPEHRIHPRFGALIAQAETLYRPLLEAGQKLGCIRGDLTMDEILALLRAVDVVIDERMLRARGPVTRDKIHAQVDFALDTFKRLLLPAPPIPRAKRPKRPSSR